MTTTRQPARYEERTNDYFLDGEGISREVIQADICRYLGNDALVRPTTHQGRAGFIITAYRNLTSNMIADLKADSARWEQDVSRRAEQGYARGSYNNPGLSPSQSPNNAPGSYVQSHIHDGRQHVGPSPVYSSAPPGQYEMAYSQPPPGAPPYGGASNQMYQQYPPNPGHGQNTNPYPPQSQSPYSSSSQNPPPLAADMHPGYTHQGRPGYPSYPPEHTPRYAGQGDEFEHDYPPVTTGMPYATTGAPYTSTAAPDVRMSGGYPPDMYQDRQQPRDRRGR